MSAYYMLSHGLAFELCDVYIKSRNEAFAAANAIGAPLKATPNQFVECGTRIEALHFGICCVPFGWVERKQFRGYGFPGRGKIGKAAKAALDAIKVPSSEKLARDLGCKPFFMDFDDGGNYCANIGVFMCGGAFYLEANKWCAPDRIKSPEITQILASEWHVAQEARNKT